MEPTRTISIRPLTVTDRIMRIVVGAVLIIGLLGLGHHVVFGPATSEAAITQE